MPSGRDHEHGANIRQFLIDDAQGIPRLDGCIRTVWINVDRERKRPFRDERRGKRMYAESINVSVALTFIRVCSGNDQMRSILFYRETNSSDNAFHLSATRQDDNRIRTANTVNCL